MSDHHIFSIVPVEMIKDDRLNKNDFKVLIAILSFRNKNTNLCMPSREKLSERCHLPVTKISVITSRLVNLGWLEKEGKGGFGKSCRYTFKVPDFLDETVTETVTVPKTETVTETVTVDGCNEPTTVTETVTVTETGTVTETVTPTVTKTVTPTVTKTVTPKEQTILTDNLNVMMVGGAKPEIPEITRYTDGKNSDPKTWEEWMQFFINEKGFSFTEAQSLGSLNMFRKWVEQGVTREDVEIASVQVLNSGKQARYPAFYGNFVADVIEAKNKPQNRTGQVNSSLSNNNPGQYKTISETNKAAGLAWLNRRNI